MTKPPQIKVHHCLVFLFAVTCLFILGCGNRNIQTPAIHKTIQLDVSNRSAIERTMDGLKGSDDIKQYICQEQPHVKTWDGIGGSTFMGIPSYYDLTYPACGIKIGLYTDENQTKVPYNDSSEVYFMEFDTTYKAVLLGEIETGQTTFASLEARYPADSLRRWDATTGSVHRGKIQYFLALDGDYYYSNYYLYSFFEDKGIEFNQEGFWQDEFFKDLPIVKVRFYRNNWKEIVGD